MAKMGNDALSDLFTPPNVAGLMRIAQFWYEKGVTLSKTEKADLEKLGSFNSPALVGYPHQTNNGTFIMADSLCEKAVELGNIPLH